MYTLLGAPLLGFDLARRTGGAGVAGLVRDAIATDDARLSALGEAWDEDTVCWLERAQAAVPTEPASTSRLVAALRDTVQLVDAGRVEEALRRLESAPVAGLPELLALVRDDVLDWTWRGTGEDRTQPEDWRRGTAVLTDAVVAAWHGSSMSRSLADQLSAPYLRVGAAPAPALGPQAPLLARLLDRVAAVGPGKRAALVAAADTARGLGAWGPAMHSASWAVHLAGRERAAAVAQMEAVQALHAGGVDAATAATGTWNLLSGAVQALVVADLVDDTTWRRLVDPLGDVLGPLRP